MLCTQLHARNRHPLNKTNLFQCVSLFCSRVVSVSFQFFPHRTISVVTVLRITCPRFSPPLALPTAMSFQPSPIGHTCGNSKVLRANPKKELTSTGLDKEALAKAHDTSRHRFPKLLYAKRFNSFNWNAPPSSFITSTVQCSTLGDSISRIVSRIPNVLSMGGDSSVV